MKMGYLYRVVVVLVLFQGLCSPAWASVFFSEYIEGSGSNKAVEIFNGSGVSIDLSAYSVQVFFNGSPTPGPTISLPSQVVLDGETFVLAHAGADTALSSAANGFSGSLNFNGNDAVGLVFNNQLLDVIGQIGVDPVLQWGGGDVGTEDHTMRRKPSVLTGDPVGTDPFDPSAQWVGFSQDTFDGLGQHTVIPEPRTLAILAAGVLLVLRRHRRWCV